MSHPSAAPADQPILHHIELEAAAVARAFGVADAKALAAALVDRLCLNLGGEAHYLPKLSRLERQRRNAAIRAAFDGRNLPELAKKHGISERRVRQIVSAHKK